MSQSHPRYRLANPGPSKPKERSFTQINHVSADQPARPQSSVERGTSNKALQAYKRRHVDDAYRDVAAHELDQGTMGQEDAKERLMLDEERLQSGTLRAKVAKDSTPRGCGHEKVGWVTSITSTTTVLVSSRAPTFRLARRYPS